jgi:hypothetical protein
MKRKRVITIELEREITTTQTTRAIRFQRAARETEAQVAPEKPDEPVLRALAAAVCCLEDDANET